MKFEANWRCYSNRYCGGVIIFGMILMFMLIRPLSAGKGFMFFELFGEFFLRDIRITGLLLGICLFAQIGLYLTSGSFSRFIVINHDKVIFHLFNKKTHELKYSDLSYIENINSVYFLFVFKDGQTQQISNSVKNSELAFEMIRKKIADANR